MKHRNLAAFALTSVIATGFSTYASAGAMSCSDLSSNNITSRTWGFDSADACGHGEGNPNDSGMIQALGSPFNESIWDYQGGVDKDIDDSSWLNVTLDPGSSWGSANITATWTLAPTFWATFGKAVFTVHVGHASHPDLSDFGAFFITEGQYSGIWSFVQDPIGGGRAGGGGGLTNADLWTSGTGINEEEQFAVPEPGILMLFATGLLGLAFGNRRKTQA